MNVTPPTAASAPGTHIWKLKMAALLTGVDPSNAARVRSSSCRRSIPVRARSDGGPS